MTLYQHELKNAYIGEVWTPWSNTIAYYPFESNINDASWNNRNLSMYTGSFTYETLSSWKKVCRLNTSSQCNNLTVPFNRTSYTVSCYVSWNTYDRTYQLVIFDLVSWSNYRPRAYEWYYSWWWKDIVSGMVSTTANWVTYTQNKWYHIVTVYNNNNASLYINWEFIVTKTLSDSSTTWTLSVNWINDFRTWYRTGGTISELILEKRAWTATEILNYYNSTKSNYWL